MAEKWRKISASWAREITSGYLRNPAAARDFKVQFRGKGTIAVFAISVFILSAVTLYMFWQVLRIGLSPSDTQDQLGVFCGVMLIILGLLISIIAPAMAASSILAEKQRKSLDLVFSSPVKPSHYLFGKLMASYRFVWILLALSVPFLAMTVLMGGGTWMNILESYFLLSMQGLLFTAVGIYFAALVEKTISALLYTYATIFAFCYGMAGLTMAAFMGVSVVPFMGGPAPLSGSFVPVLVELVVGTTTNLFGVQIPNTLLATVLTGGAVSVILRAAGGLVSPLHDRERRRLRLFSGLIFTALAGLIGLFSSAPAWAGYQQNLPNGTGFLCLSLALIPFVPFLACYSPESERRRGHDGLFKVRDLWGASVAGALPYIFSVVGLGAWSFFLTSVFSGKKIGPEVFAEIAYAFGFWTMVWGTARFASSFLHGARASRTLQFLTLAAIVGLPLPLFAALSRHALPDDNMRALWSFNWVSPFIYNVGFLPTAIHALIFGLLGAAMAIWSEKNYLRRHERRRAAKIAEEAASETELDLSGLNYLVKKDELVQNRLRS